MDIENHACRVCGAVKPLTDFFVSRSMHNGRESACKACSIARRLASADTIVVEQRQCTSCGETKPANAFSRNRYTKDGLHYECKTCHYRRRVTWGKERIEHLRTKARENYRKNHAAIRDRDLSRKLGIPPGTYAKMLAAQGGVCAICGRSENHGKFRFAIDHCHDSGRIRGLLCTCCNQALGQLKDSPELFRRAADYLETHVTPPSTAGGDRAPA